MTVSFRSFSSSSGNNSVSLTRPTNTAVGDMLIALIGADIPTAITAPDGTWTEISNRSYAGGSFMQGAAFFKVAVNDSGPYVFGTTDWSVGHLLCIEKDSGNWNDPDGVNLWSTSEAATATLVTASVTPASGDCLICGWVNDGARTVSSAPSGMTVTGLASNSYFSGVAYYQDSMSAGGVTKSLEWSVADQTISHAIVVGAAAAGTAGVKIFRRRIEGY